MSERCKRCNQAVPRAADEPKTVPVNRRSLLLHAVTTIVLMFIGWRIGIYAEARFLAWVSGKNVGNFSGNLLAALEAYAIVKWHLLPALGVWSAFLLTMSDRMATDFERAIEWACTKDPR